MFDNDTESRDAWSVSMATPQSEEQQVNLVELVDAANSSTSGDELCSNLSNVEHSGSSGVEQRDDMKGEVISQRFVVKQGTQDEGCHRAPLTVSYHFNWNTDTFIIKVDCTVSLIQVLLSYCIVGGKKTVYKN